MNAGTVDTALGSIEVARAGTASGNDRAVVYLHSLLGEGLDAALPAALASHHALIAPRLPGFGDSQGGDAVDSMEDVAFHLRDLWERLELHGSPVVATSLGGWAALALAIADPQAISRLVLVNPVGLFLPDPPFGELFGRAPDDLVADLYADIDGDPAQALLVATGARISVQIPTWDEMRDALQALGMVARLGWNPYLADLKLAERLSWVRVPVTVIQCAGDRIVPVAHAERLGELLPNAEVHVLSGGSHLAAIEGVDGLADIVTAALA